MAREPQSKYWSWGWCRQETDLAHSAGSMLLAPDRVPEGMASGYRLRLLPVGRQTGGSAGIGPWRVQPAELKPQPRLRHGRGARG